MQQGRAREPNERQQRCQSVDCMEEKAPGNVAASTVQILTMRIVATHGLRIKGFRIECGRTTGTRTQSDIDI